MIFSHSLIHCTQCNTEKELYELNDMLQSTYKWKSALAILCNQLSFMFVMLKNKSFSSFQQQFVLMSKIEQLVIRRRNYEQYCNSFFIFLGTRVWVLTLVYRYQNPGISGNLVVKSKPPPRSGSSLEAVEPHP